MKHDSHLATIDQLLRSIPKVERSLNEVDEEKKKRSLKRSLRNLEKRFDHLIPFRFRLQLHNMCKEFGIDSDLL